MKSRLLAHTMGIPVTSMECPDDRAKRLLLDHPSSQYYNSNATLKLNQNKVDTMNKLVGKADNLASGIREHVRLWPKISEAVKGKLSLGAKILKAGEVEKAYSLFPPTRLPSAARDLSNFLLQPASSLEFVIRKAIDSQRKPKCEEAIKEVHRISYCG
ncbi:hypothetical protein Acr_00g0064150 [Actinidia rufa]|uniref:Uncharacterized protein n=1 Tax=Actinidia rufa TaxID=165716 RepID=A0A7J0DRA5_9ERIC|nr:hypothetical protein Acr_00g0064150 [Actinidia rufa]